MRNNDLRASRRSCGASWTRRAKKMITLIITFPSVRAPLVETFLVFAGTNKKVHQEIRFFATVGRPPTSQDQRPTERMKASQFASKNDASSLHVSDWTLLPPPLKKEKATNDIITRKKKYLITFYLGIGSLRLQGYQDYHSIREPKPITRKRSDTKYVVEFNMYELFFLPKA